MRTTVDLPPATDRLVRELARRQGKTLSAVIAELTSRGLSQLDEPLAVSEDPVSGFPVVSIGRRITSAEVAAILDEE